MDKGRSASEHMVAELDKHRDKIERYEAFCDEIGEDPANVALAWLLTRPAITAPIIGPRTIAQLDGTVRALEVKLDDKALARIEEIFPATRPRRRSTPGDQPLRSAPTTTMSKSSTSTAGSTQFRGRSTSPP